MIDRDAVEKALLVNVVRNKDWEVIITNGIDEAFFTFANRRMFNYIRDYTKKGEFPDIQILCYEFKIDDVAFQDYIQITDIQGLCQILKDEHIREQVQYQVSGLNEYSDEMNKDPRKYVERIGEVYSNLKTLGYTNKTVGLFEDIEKVLQIDPSNVISTGFAELDEVLTGWRRGEELAVFMARTGQGKSWLGLKFALAGALQGFRVGIYSGEMSIQQLQERIICCAKPEYSSTKEDALQFLQEKKPFIRVITPRELRRRANVDDIEEMIVTEKLDLMIVDQLSLMEDVKRNGTYGIQLRQQYGNISADLFQLSQKYPTAMILLAQVNREGAKSMEGPELENLSESDAVAQNATRVIAMRNDNGNLTMRVVKNRYGTCGNTLKYEVDYGINKYKPIREFGPDLGSMKVSKARMIFGGPSKGGPF